jgi:tyrosine-protein kinase Etk/Wzc
MIAPKVYEVDSSIMPPEENQSGGNLSGFLQNLSGGLSIGGMAQSNKSQIFSDILKSKNLAKYIIDSLNLKINSKFSKLNNEELISLMSTLIDVNPKKSGLIAISVSLSSNFFSTTEDNASTAKLATDIANKAIEGLEYFTRNKSTSKAKRKRIFIEKMLADKMAILDSIDKKLEGFRIDNKAFEIEEQAKAVLTNAISVGSELAKAEIELKLKQQEFDGNAGNLNFYLNKVGKLKEQYSDVQSGGLSGKDQFSIPLKNIPGLIREYTNLVREQKIMEQVKLYLETQKYQETIQEVSDIPTIEVLDKATVPEKPIAPVKSLVLIVSLLVSILIALLVIMISAYRKNEIYFKKV